MTSKEALEEIESIYEHEEGTQHPYDDPIGKKNIYKKEFNILRELVERDTPLKVIRSDNSSVISANCPKCKRVVDNGYKGCPYCLQRLDWRRIKNDKKTLD